MRRPYLTARDGNLFTPSGVWRVVERLRPKTRGLLLVVLVAGCARSGVSHTTGAAPTTSVTPATTPIAKDTSGRVVPWVDRPWVAPIRTTTTTTTRPDAPACSSGALSVFEVGGGGAAGENYFVVTLKSAMHSWCSLHTVTAASAVDRSGRRIALHLSTTDADEFRVAPSGFVNVVLETPDVCGPNRDQLPALHYESVWLSMRAVHLAVPQLHLVACDNEFTTDLDVYAPPPRLPKPGSANALTATIEPGYRVAHGVIDYIIDLRNPTSAVFPLDTCAIYTEWFASVDPSVYVKREYELNCDTVHQIGPHGVVRYAMRLAIPLAARSGKLDWQFGAGFAATAVQF